MLFLIKIKIFHVGMTEVFKIAAICVPKNTSRLCFKLLGLLDYE